ARLVLRLLGVADFLGGRIAPGLRLLGGQDCGAAPFVDRQQRRRQRRQPAPLQAGVEGLRVIADRFDVVHGGKFLNRAWEGAPPVPHPSYPAKAGYPVRRGVPILAEISGILDHPHARDGTGYSAGLAADGAPAEAGLFAAAFFSTMRTAKIAPS